MPLAAQLREETRLEHAALEKKLVTRIKSIRTKEAYIRLLGLFHGYYHALELKMDQYLTADRIPDVAQRRKSCALLQDIGVLGGMPPTALATDLPGTGNYPAALGAAYVMEGSTLGGEIIARMVRGQVSDLPEKGGFAFFLCYGEDAGEMWKKFHGYLNALENDDECKNAVAAARETFIKFSHWIDQYESIFEI